MTQTKMSTQPMRWDAGEAGCSRLVMGLRRQLEEIAPGAMLEVVARDPSAVIDIEVWCGMTGHRLLSAAHPIYLVQRNGG